MTFTETDGLAPAMFSGDGKNPFPGPMTCPFVIYDLPDGQTLQFTLSSRSDAGEGDHFVKSVLRYPTPSSRLTTQHAKGG